MTLFCYSKNSWMHTLHSGEAGSYLQLSFVSLDFVPSLCRMFRFHWFSMVHGNKVKHLSTCKSFRWLIALKMNKQPLSGFGVVIHLRVQQFYCY